MTDNTQTLERSSNPSFDQLEEDPGLTNIDFLSYTQTMESSPDLQLESSCNHDQEDLDIDPGLILCCDPFRVHQCLQLRSVASISPPLQAGSKENM